MMETTGAGTPGAGPGRATRFPRGEITRTARHV
jgi:hypothetical protein